MGAREEIMHLINQYAFTVDTGDLDGFAGLFEHGEWGVEGTKPMVGKKELRDALSNLIIYKDGTPKTRHVITNVDLEISKEEGTAKGECYITVFQQTDELPLQTIFSGHYFDDFEFVDGSWRFRKRLICNVLIGNMSAHLKNASKVVPDA